MDFVEKELFFLSFCWLSLGTFGALVDHSGNVAVVVGTPNATLICKSDAAGSAIEFFFQAAGDDKALNVKSSALVAYFTADTNQEKKGYRLYIKSASMSLAGLYYCFETQKIYFQFIVLSENPTCSFSPRQTKQLLCNDALGLTLSCSVSYTANWTYVVHNIKWTTDDSPSKSLQGSMDSSRSGNLTTATSTLKVTWPAGSGVMPVYRCNTTFSLIAGLSSDFITTPPDFNYLCKPFKSPDDVPCTKEEPKQGESTSTTGKKNEVPTITTEKKNEVLTVTVEKNEAPTVTTEENNAPTVTVEKNEAPTVTTEKKNVATTDEVAEKQKHDNTEGSSIVSSDTNIVLLSVVGSLLLAQSF